MLCSKLGSAFLSLFPLVPYSSFSHFCCIKRILYRKRDENSKKMKKITPDGDGYAVPPPCALLLLCSLPPGPLCSTSVLMIISSLPSDPPKHKVLS